LRRASVSRCSRILARYCSRTWSRSLGGATAATEGTSRDASSDMIVVLFVCVCVCVCVRVRVWFGDSIRFQCSLVQYVCLSLFLVMSVRATLY